MPLVNLDINNILISKIEAKKEQRFKDPYVYNPNQDDAEGGAPVPDQEPFKPIASTQQPLPNFKYAVGAPVKDSDNGDAGLLPKKSRFFPFVNFIRSKYCTSQNLPSTLDHSAGGSSTSRTIKEYNITTGLSLSYLGTFDVAIYNIQKPSKDCIIGDYSSDFFNKLIAQKKLS